MTPREQFLADIITAAVEGGIGYWSTTDHYQWTDDEGVHVCLRGLDDREAAKHGALAIIRVLGVDGAYEHEQYWITPGVVSLGLQLLTSKDGSYPYTSKARLRAAMRDNDAGDIDSDDADCIVQAGLFGEIVYG